MKLFFVNIRQKIRPIVFLAMTIILAVACTRNPKESSAAPPDLLSYVNSAGDTALVHTLAEWELKRAQILQGMTKVMGRLPDMSDLPSLDVQFRDSLKTDSYIRYTIRFTAREEEMVPAYLYIPFQRKPLEKLPAMVVLHGTGALGKQLVDGASPKAGRAHAKELAQRGYVVIAPDYPSMGELKDYDFENDHYVSGTMKGIFNHMRCVDLLQARGDVDPKRIGIIGHSLGGHNAMFAGAFDPRLKVIVSSCGWTLMEYYNAGEKASEKWGGRLGPWAKDCYMPLLRDRYNLDPAKVPFDFDGVIAALAPRAFFSNSPLNDGNFDANGVRTGMVNALQVYRFLGAEDRLQARYPDAGHDFPTGVRLEAYRFIDKVLQHAPKPHQIEY